MTISNCSHYMWFRQQWMLCIYFLQFLLGSFFLKLFSHSICCRGALGCADELKETAQRSIFIIMFWCQAQLLCQHSQNRWVTDREIEKKSILFVETARWSLFLFLKLFERPDNGINIGLSRTLNRYTNDCAAHVGNAFTILTN